MNELKNGNNELTDENWSQTASEIAKNSSFSFSLEGWPAAVTLISLPIAGVAIYAIRTLAA